MLYILKFSHKDCFGDEALIQILLNEEQQITSMQCFPEYIKILFTEDDSGRQKRKELASWLNRNRTRTTLLKKKIN